MRRLPSRGCGSHFGADAWGRGKSLWLSLCAACLRFSTYPPFIIVLVQLLTQQAASGIAQRQRLDRQFAQPGGGAPWFAAPEQRSTHQLYYKRSEALLQTRGRQGLPPVADRCSHSAAPAPHRRRSTLQARCHHTCRSWEPARAPQLMRASQSCTTARVPRQRSRTTWRSSHSWPH